MSNFKAYSDVILADEFSQMQNLPEEQRAEHFQDHIGIGVFGRVGELDVMLAGTIYRVGGDVWGMEDGCLLQTNMIVAEPGDREMKNNTFVGHRFDAANTYPNLSVTHEPDSVIWSAGNRQIICRPPYWELKGEHMGVDIDIRFTGTGNCMPYHGPWDKLAETGIAGNEQLGRAEGHFTHDGNTYELTQGWAVRERTCLGEGKDVMALLGSVSGYIWGWCFSEKATIFFYAQRNRTGYGARIFTDGRVIDLTGPNNYIEEVSHYTDVLTQKVHPTAWKIDMKDENGTIEMDVKTWSRCLFGFHQRDGYTSHHGGLGRCTGAFTTKDGERFEFDDTTAYFEQGCATPLGIGSRPRA